MASFKKPSNSGGSDYEVGYGRPPKAHQFQPGKSGNPKGRPKGSISLAKEAEKLLNETVRTADGARRITRRRHLVRAMYAKATQGNASSLNALMRLAAEAQSAPEAPTQTTLQLTSEHLKWLEDIQSEAAEALKRVAGEGET